MQGTPIEFESDLFVGRVAMWVKGLPTAAPDLFKGKRRRTRITVQGRFKRSLPFEEVRIRAWHLCSSVIFLPCAKVTGAILAGRSYDRLWVLGRQTIPPCVLRGRVGNPRRPAHV